MNSSARLLLLTLALVFNLSSHVAAQNEDFGVDVENLLRAAQGGDVERQFELGYRMILGEGLKKNPAEGAKWIEKAAKADYVKAMHVLGSLYEIGSGVGKDAKQAAGWFQRAADKGFPDSQFSLALLYENGNGVEKNQEKATKLALDAANQGFSPGQTLYASKLVNGAGVPKNPAKGALWFLKAAKQDHPYAQRQLAYLYYTGNGVPLDYERCQAWYRRAAQVSQDPWAKNDLAWFLATCPDAKYHRGEEAAELAKSAVMALEVDQGEQRHEIIDTMAAALARNGQYAEALIWQQRCLKLLEDDKDAPTEERTKLKAEFDERLKLYKQEHPYADKPSTPLPEMEPLYNDTILQDNNNSETRDPSLQPKPRQNREAPPKTKGKAA